MTFAKLRATLATSSTPASMRRIARSARTPCNTVSNIPDPAPGRPTRLLVALCRLEHELHRLVQIRIILRQILADAGDLRQHGGLLRGRQADQHAALVFPDIALLGKELVHERNGVPGSLCRIIAHDLLQVR